MIHEVDESLQELVRRDVLNGSNVEIAFDGPTREWAARRSGPTLNLYLYDIQEDLERREIQFEEVRDERGRVLERRMPPRRFRLSYLVTAWTQRPEDEHRLLSAVLAAFIARDAIPPELLRGSLAGQPGPVRTTIGLPLPKDRQLSDIWSALGGELRASLDLVVTAPFVTNRTLDVGPLVIEEPRIGFIGPEGRDEQPSRGRATVPDVSGADDEAARETALGGRPGSGRNVRIGTLPGPGRR